MWLFPQIAPIRYFLGFDLTDKKNYDSRDKRSDIIKFVHFTELEKNYLELFSPVDGDPN